jgi:DNA adenine methylase
LFLYLNRHCYNGLIRYNSKGEFNTPFGRYVKPYFPEREMRHFINAAEKATFLHASFTESMPLAQRGDIVYCDPPYAPLSGTAYFADYYTGGFKWRHQVQLVELARRLADRGIQVVISNHDTREIRELYKNAKASIIKFQVRRYISRDINNRRKVGELLAVFA